MTCTSNGGKPEKRDLPYDPPVGPKGIMSGGGSQSPTRPAGTQGSH